MITYEEKIHTKGVKERIIKRCLAELMREFELRLKVTFVPSEKNQLNVLTKGKKMWMGKTGGINQQGDGSMQFRRPGAEEKS